MKLKTGNLTFIDLLWISINNVPALGPFLLTPFLPPSTVLVLRGLTLRATGLRLHHHLLPARSGQWDGSPRTELLTSDTSCLGNTPSSPPPPTRGAQTRPAVVNVLAASYLVTRSFHHLLSSFLVLFWKTCRVLWLPPSCQDPNSIYNTQTYTHVNAKCDSSPTPS